MQWLFQKIIDSSKCRCQCHCNATEFWPEGVPKDDPIHALTACQSCARFHRLAFVTRKKRKPGKPFPPPTQPPPQGWEDEDGG